MSLFEDVESGKGGAVKLDEYSVEDFKTMLSQYEERMKNNHQTVWYSGFDDGWACGHKPGYLSGLLSIAVPWLIISGLDRIGYQGGASNNIFLPMLAFVSAYTVYSLTWKWMHDD